MRASLQRARPAALLAVARTVPPAVVVVGALTVLPTVVVAFRTGPGSTGTLFAASVIAGAGAGYVTEDAAAPTLASSPTTLAVRRMLRSIAIVAILLAAWLGARLVVAADGGHVPPMSDLFAEFVASAALSVAFASRGRPDAPVVSGPGAAAGAVLAMLTISSLSRNWPVLPAVGVPARHERWWWVATAGLAAVAWSWRDPAARTRRTRRSVVGMKRWHTRRTGSDLLSVPLAPARVQRLGDCSVRLRIRVRALGRCDDVPG